MCSGCVAPETPGKLWFTTIKRNQNHESNTAVHPGLRTAGTGGRFTVRLSLASQIRHARGLRIDGADRPCGLGQHVASGPGVLAAGASPLGGSRVARVRV